MMPGSLKRKRSDNSLRGFGYSNNTSSSNSLRRRRTDPTSNSNGMSNGCFGDPLVSPWIAAAAEPAGASTSLNRVLAVATQKAAAAAAAGTSAAAAATAGSIVASRMPSPHREWVVHNSAHHPQQLEWVLPSYDPETAETQSMKEELHRLQVLKSYHAVNDSRRDESFDRMTALAARTFDVPIAALSLVDLGRQHFLSSYGLGDAKEMAQRTAFGALTELTKNELVVVPDTMQDARFKDHPGVSGQPFVRFYAGAPLISPEGYRLGAFCVASPKPRTASLTDNQKAVLQEMADMVVDTIVDRRSNMESQHPTELVAYSAHALMTPLTGLELALNLLEDDDIIKSLAQHQLQHLHQASGCSEFMSRICKTMDSIRRGCEAPVTSEGAQSENGDKKSPPSSPTQVMKRRISSSPVKRVRMADLVNNLYLILEPIPKRVPLVIRLDPHVPEMVDCDDLKLLRASVNLLTNANSRTKTGSIQLRVLIRGEDQESGSSTQRQCVVFECEDTGTNIPVEEYQYLYQPSRIEDGHLRMSLSSIANLIDSLSGRYGFHPRAVNHARGAGGEGSVFWFSVPLVPDSMLRGVVAEEAPASTVLPRRLTTAAAAAAVAQVMNLRCLDEGACSMMQKQPQKQQQRLTTKSSSTSTLASTPLYSFADTRFSRGSNSNPDTRSSFRRLVSRSSPSSRHVVFADARGKRLVETEAFGRRKRDGDAAAGGGRLSPLAPRQKDDQGDIAPN